MVILAQIGSALVVAVAGYFIVMGTLNLIESKLNQWFPPKDSATRARARRQTGEL